MLGLQDKASEIDAKILEKISKQEQLVAIHDQILQQIIADVTAIKGDVRVMRSSITTAKAK